MEDTSTAQDLVASPERLTRFWVALIGLGVVFGSGGTALMINQAEQSRDLTELAEIVRMLTITTATTATQTQEYQRNNNSRVNRLENQADNN